MANPSRYPESHIVTAEYDQVEVLLVSADKGHPYTVTVDARKPKTLPEPNDIVTEDLEAELGHVPDLRQYEREINLSRRRLYNWKKIFRIKMCQTNISKFGK